MQAVGIGPLLCQGICIRQPNVKIRGNFEAPSSAAICISPAHHEDSRPLPARQRVQLRVADAAAGGVQRPEVGARRRQLRRHRALVPDGAAITGGSESLQHLILGIVSCLFPGSLSVVASSDPWCLQDATATRAFTVLALLAAIVGFILSVMVAFDIKIPTWNGEGKETTLVTPVVCSLVETVALIPAVALWQRMVTGYNEQCRQEMKINTFTCIKTGSTFILAIAAIPFAAVTKRKELGKLQTGSHSQRKQARADRFRFALFLSNALVLTIFEDNVDEILSGIANKIDIDANGSDGRNALHWACTLHRTSICHVLLKKGASISKKDRDGWTPLHWASRVGNLDSVRLLAKYGANLNVQDRWGTTPLMLTVVGESKIAAETLIELGASVDARNVGDRPYTLHSITRVLLSPVLRSPAIVIVGGTPLHQIGMVFLNAGSNLALQDAQGMTALHYAAANGSVNLLMNMLQQCDSQLVEKPNKFGEALSYLAVLHSQPKILELVRNWREGNPIVASYEDDDDDDDEVATGADSADDDDGSDDDSEQ
ncbi:hypothetical protein ON010_g9027 [Phytophthora cinnamomi]|nr:hypothetical protein ON010_g9027 [Phytophthora cinnamomi]